MNDTDANKQTQEETMSAYKKANMMKQYHQLLNLLPHGRHKNQKGTKGAFGKRKRLTCK